MIVDEKLEKPLWCSCGGKVDKVSIGYGRTPYMIHCHNCKCDLHKVLPGGIGGVMQNAIDAWNDYHDIVGVLKEYLKRDPRESEIRAAMYKKFKWGIEPRWY